MDGLGFSKFRLSFVPVSGWTVSKWCTSGRVTIQYFNFDGMAIQKHQGAAATTTSATSWGFTAAQKRLYETDDLCTVAKIKTDHPTSAGLKLTRVLMSEWVNNKSSHQITTAQILPRMKFGSMYLKNNSNFCSIFLLLLFYLFFSSL